MAFFCINDLIINDMENKNIVDLFSVYEKKLIVKDSLALVGQSGSGKSLTLKTILNLLPENLNKTFLYESDFELNYKNISFIPQNAFTALSPMTKIKNQFFLEDQSFSTRSIDEILKMVELDERIKDRFPMQLSGGQLQRVIIAIALSKKPKLLLLDEPTTALDQNTKQNIIELLKKLKKSLDFLIIFVSHDIDSIKNICDQIVVLENGKIVEAGQTIEVINSPQHQYTKNLILSNFSLRDFRK